MPGKHDMKMKGECTCPEVENLNVAGKGDIVAGSHKERKPRGLLAIRLA